jgi:hypothetical protein
VQHLHPGILGVEGVEALVGAVGAGVVHEHDLVGAAGDLLQHRAQALEERDQVVLLVEVRQHDAENRTRDHGSAGSIGDPDRPSKTVTQPTRRLTPPETVPTLRAQLETS